MASDGVFFKADEVKSKMSEIENLFSNFADLIKKINDYIETTIDAGAESAIYTENYSKKLLKLWEANASTFGDFYENFESWSQAVSIITQNNSNFVVETVDLYKSDSDGYKGDTGGTLKGIEDARNSMLSSSTNQLSSESQEVLENAQLLKNDISSSNANEVVAEGNSNNDSLSIGDYINQIKDGNLDGLTAYESNDEVLSGYYYANVSKDGKEYKAVFSSGDTPSLQYYEDASGNRYDSSWNSLKDASSSGSSLKGEKVTQAVSASENYSGFGFVGSAAVASSLASSLKNYSSSGDDNSFVSGVSSEGSLHYANISSNGKTYTAYFDEDSNLLHYEDSDGNYYNADGTKIEAKDAIKTEYEYKNLNKKQEIVSGSNTDSTGSIGEDAKNNITLKVNDTAKLDSSVNVSTNASSSNSGSGNTTNGSSLSANALSNSNDTVTLNVGDKHSFTDSNTGVESNYTYAGYSKNYETYYFKDENGNLCVLDTDGKMKEVFDVNNQFYSGVANSLGKDVMSIN